MQLTGTNLRTGLLCLTTYAVVIATANFRSKLRLYVLHRDLPLSAQPLSIKTHLYSSIGLSIPSVNISSTTTCLGEEALLGTHIVKSGI